MLEERQVREKASCETKLGKENMGTNILLGKKG